jgi:hypothetical protein
MLTVTGGLHVGDPAPFLGGGLNINLDGILNVNLNLGAVPTSLGGLGLGDVNALSLIPGSSVGGGALDSVLPLNIIPTINSAANPVAAGPSGTLHQETSGLGGGILNLSGTTINIPSFEIKH